jgi:hypothetical protein
MQSARFVAALIEAFHKLFAKCSPVSLIATAKMDSGFGLAQQGNSYSATA